MDEKQFKTKYPHLSHLEGNDLWDAMEDGWRDEHKEDKPKEITDWKGNIIKEGDEICQPIANTVVVRSLSRRFADCVWSFLKPIGYKRNGNNFVYTGKELKTIVNIQRGKYSNTQSAYSMINISYAKKFKKVKTINDAEFFHFRHDYFNTHGFFAFGSNTWSEFPCSLDYKNENEIQDVIKILKTVEPYFRIETIKKIEETYKPKMSGGAWDEVFKRLSS